MHHGNILITGLKTKHLKMVFKVCPSTGASTQKKKQFFKKLKEISGH
jgi:hypothetical protein